jgi:mRNA-degrading endonuclease toxin of MazEF toxin-antitoxin module
MKRGEIYWGVYPEDTQKKKRPLLIISNNLVNSNDRAEDVIVVKVTSLVGANSTKKRINPREDVVIKLEKDSIIRCGKIFTVRKIRLKPSAYSVPLDKMKEVDQCLKNALGLF